MFAATHLCGFGAGGNDAVQPLWNAADKDSDINLSDDDRTATAVGTGGVRSVLAITGKRYFEFVSGLNSSSNGRFGVANGSYDVTTAPGAGSNEWVIQGDGQKLTSGSASGYGSALANGTTGMLAVDPSSGKIWVGAAGSWFNSGDPAAGTGEMFSTLTGTLYLVMGRPTGSNRSITLRLVADYTYSPPTGFVAGG
ncbi:MAG: hypothetical protein AB7P02_00020 [Alphaproteobacteria bacterium]